LQTINIITATPSLPHQFWLYASNAAVFLITAPN